MNKNLDKITISYFLLFCLSFNPLFSNWCISFFSGKYVCVKCGFDLFSSNAKYEHSSPWPAFSETLRPDSLYKRPETAEIFKVCFTLVLVHYQYTQLYRKIAIFNTVISWPNLKVNTISVKLSNNRKPCIENIHSIC